ncbi:hypothetical protein CAS74_002402 [Pichia kudriavzevii]|uniref:DNA replication complex GINS protein PSF2 n=2 Tax=Pichia kudriavzevii TaxID=4909 RepID=A0A1Z8JPY6_PICKU|nr:uncharacterized protein C5L36_0D04220 [Pichia kudriavzevii]AWU77694.1 hypothetical protein C5L36_0D04220 [Pichia kudriavzevii]OUT22657.1 hypothetical protein CAS74_002402 [Pichia kudriavzevii]
MVLDKRLIERSLSVKEVAFLAEQEPISILPRYTMNGIKLIGRDMKKLKPLQKTDVPLWIALLLKKQHKCNIVIPPWLSVPYLKNKHAEEQRLKDRVTDLPWHWIPTAKLLLEACPDDFIDSPHEIRSLIQDLREVRLLKTRQGFTQIDDDYLELTGLSLMEINEIRPFLLQTMDKLHDLKKVSAEEDVNNAEKGDYSRHNSNHENLNENYNHNININSSFQGNGSRYDSSDVDEELSHNVSANDATLVEQQPAPMPATKRQRVGPRANTSTEAHTNNMASDSDSDSDVEYRR